MSIQVPADLEASIRERVMNGSFSDPSEVIREAMRLLDEQECQLASLRAKLQVGLDEADQGKTDEWTPELREKIRQSARRRAQLGEQPDPEVCP